MVTKQQIDQIVDNINTVLDRARNHIYALEDLCDNDYLHGRGQYPITALVYTAFDVERQNIPGLMIQKVQYGRNNLYLPELFNNEVYIEVYGDTSKPWTTDEVKMKFGLLGNRFHLLLFSIVKETYRLKKLQFLSFDGYDVRGNVHISKRETIYLI